MEQPHHLRKKKKKKTNRNCATHGVVIYISRTRDFRKFTSACFRAYNIVHCYCSGITIYYIIDCTCVYRVSLLVNWRKVKNPNRVEAGKRVGAISREAKARKAAERKKKEEEELCVGNTNILYVTVGVLGVAGLGYGAYNFFCKKEEQQQQEVEQPQPKKKILSRYKIKE